MISPARTRAALSTAQVDSVVQLRGIVGTSKARVKCTRARNAKVNVRRGAMLSRVTTELLKALFEDASV